MLHEEDMLTWSNCCSNMEQTSTSKRILFVIYQNFNMHTYSWCVRVNCFGWFNICFVLKEKSALMIACENQRISIAVLLIAAGAEVHHLLHQNSTQSTTYRYWCDVILSGWWGSSGNVEKRRRQDRVARCHGWFQQQFHSQVTYSIFWWIRLIMKLWYDCCLCLALLITVWYCSQ